MYSILLFYNKSRPPVDFNLCSERTKRKNTEQLRSCFSTSELTFGALMNQIKNENEDSAKIIKEITYTTPTRGKKIRNAWQTYKRQQKPAQMTTDEALGLIISASLSVNQYKLLRKQALKLNHNIYPAYNKVLAAKNDSYPDEISITEDIYEVNITKLYNN